jgi:regulator of sirC expression with transglutaminase-like and TPR domain
MTRTHTALLATFLLLAMPVAPHAAPVDSKLPPDIETLLALPDDKIDVGMAALIFAREIFPDQVDVIADSHELDRLAEETRTSMSANASTDEALLALSAVLKREGFHYDFAGTTPTTASLGFPDKAEDYFLPATLQLKHGTCVTLPMLYFAIAQRLGLAVQPAGAPQHTYLKITDPYTRFQNWEATSGGPKLSAHLVDDFNISPAALASGTYMRPWTNHEYLAVLLTMNGHYYARAGFYDEAIKYFKRAAEINPTYDYAIVGLMGVYLQKLFYRTQIGEVSGEDINHAARYLANVQHYSDRLCLLGVNYEDYDEYQQHHQGEDHNDEFLYVN